MPSFPIINVSQVKKLSPFRYPGGKTWFYPHFANWLRWVLTKRPDLEAHLVEPFAGGASVGLNTLNDGLVDRLTLIEINFEIATFWKVVFSEKATLLIEKIRGFNLTPDNIERVFSEQGGNEVDIAFRVLLKNRISYGGIITKGAGRIKRGENNRGLSSRWYPTTLVERIKHLYKFRSKVTVMHGDGMLFLKENIDRPLILFVDPPYTVSKKGPGHRLYDHSEVDHKTLLKLLADSNSEFLATYNDAEEIIELAQETGLDYFRVPMLARKGVVVNELVLCKDASWIEETSSALGL